MKEESKFVIGCILAIVLFMCFIFYQRKFENSCKQIVVFENGDTCNVKRINFYNSGFSDVQLCNGERLTIRTDNIDTIINIKNNEK